jgi:5-methyltetrahydrofolate--homocysteine methyltransferase
MVNSISAEREVLDELLPMAREFGAVIVGMPVGRGGLSRTMEERLDLTAEIIISAEKSGIPREDIVIDAICLASAVEPGSMQVTFEVLRAIHNRWGVTTILGIGNAGYGMPKPTWIDLSYLLAAIPWGLDAALANPETPGLVQAVRAADFLTGNDRAGKRYIRYCRKGI